MKALIGLAAALAASSAAAQAPAPEPSLSLWRLDCGRIEDGIAWSSPWLKAPMPVPCFLVRHGSRYLLWDAGLSARALGNAHPTLKLDRTISDQLRQIGVKPDQIEFVATSHYHGDHTGQASQFPRARLIIGAGDLAALKSSPPPQGAAPTHLAPWIGGGAPVDALIEDKDVFGDGRVVVLATPGHTPGHLALLVKLAGGNVMLSGDLWATHGNVLTDDMPGFNTSRAETAASRERFRRLAYKLDATVILQHEIADVAKLPAFPKAAS